MNAPAPVALADRILAALAEKPRTEPALRAVFPRVHPDALHIKLVELQRAGRAVCAENSWRLAPGTNAAVEVERVQAAAKVVKREPLPPPPLDPGPVVLTQRTCTKCHETKSIDEFAWASKAKGERHAKCKTCTRAYFRQREEQKRAQSEAAVERLRAAPPQTPTPAPAAPPSVEISAAPATAPAAEEAIETSENVLPFPGARPAPKSLEDVVNRQRASARVTAMKRIVVVDPETGVWSMLLSDAGERALREQLAGT